MTFNIFRLHIFICYLFYSFSIATFASDQKNESLFLVVLDPGHGGNDTGAVKNKIKESDLVLNIAKKITDKIKKNDSFIQVELTRTQNKYVSLEDRTKKMQADLFISLHANSSISTKVQGAEFYFGQDKNKDQKIKTLDAVHDIVNDLESIGKNKHSYILSQTLQSQWHLSSSIIRRAPFFVLEKTSSPAILVEIGFLTNTVEAEKLKTDAYQNEIAETIANAVIQYKKSIQ